ncbi:MAG TPA: ATP-binding protein [Salinivirgaceae bacterium]|nr:ATP-binding protein [Salinivirgaceae bacterium]
MKKSKTKISFILTVLLTIISIVVGKLGCYYSKSSIDKEHIESVIHAKQAKALEYLAIAKEVALENGFEYLPKDFLDIKEQYSNQNQIYLTIYKNWHLKHWPIHKIVLPEVFDPDLFSQRVVLLGHSYYLSLHTRVENIDIVVLSFIKTQYKYKNEYLEDEFANDFNLSGDVRITTNFLSETRIYDSDKNYLFSIEGESSVRWSSFLIWTSLLVFLFASVSFFQFIASIIDLIATKKGLLWAVIISSLVSTLVRLILFFTNTPGFLFEGDLFSPELFASDMMFSTLGDSLINALWIFLFVIAIYLHVFRQEKKGIKIEINRYLLVVSGIVISLVALYIASYVTAVVKDSNIELELYKILNVNSYTFIALLVLLIVVSTYLLVSYLSLKLLHTYYKLKQIAISHFISIVVVAGSLFYLYNISVFEVLFFLFLTLVTYVFYLRKKYHHLFVVVVIVALSLYFVFKTNYNYGKKWFDSNRVTALRLTSSDDLNTEFQLHEISSQISKDTALQNIVSNSGSDFARVSNYINKQYFSEISRLYNVRILCFMPHDSVFVDSSSVQWQPWRQHYENRTHKSGLLVPNSDYYRLYRSTGTTRYIGFHLIHSLLPQNLTIVVELDDKLYRLKQSLHSLLFHDRLDYKSDNTDFSYAIYYDDRLISKVGTFDYRTRIDYQADNTEGVFTEQYFDGYKQLIYRIDKNQTMVICEPKVNIYDMAIWFSYTFVIYYIIILLVSIIFKLPLIKALLVPTIQNRIQNSMALALFVSIFVVGVASIHFTFRITQHKYTEAINEKITSVSKEMNGQFAMVKDLNHCDDDYFEFLMSKYSEVFNTDISLYDITGKLAASSLRDLYDENIIGSKMNYEAFRSFSDDNLSKLIIYEKIGKLKYYSAYIPLINSQGTVLGFVNLPFIGQDNAKTKDRASMIVALINIYVLLILLSILLTVFISNKVTRPLLIVKQKLQDFDIKKQNTPIEYEGADEIADLITEYNRMVSELSKSTKLLAQTERESAWQSMARQVAHEIKNPLTPMKLNIQLLQRAWDDRAYDFDNRLNRVCKILVEQIEALSNIATEFSSFAQMPKGQYENIDIYEAALSCVALFEETKNVKITVETDKKTDLIVVADGDQIIRMFTNLIKNAIQAIPEERLGLINIKMKTQDENVLISVSDNGIGIPADMQKRMFQPNFTTKSSGMGLGLAMVKNIIVSIDGAIWYETQENEGTTFFIQIPLAINN